LSYIQAPQCYAWRAATALIEQGSRNQSEDEEAAQASDDDDEDDNEGRPLVHAGAVAVSSIGHRAASRAGVSRSWLRLSIGVGCGCGA